MKRGRRVTIAVVSVAIVQLSIAGCERGGDAAVSDRRQLVERCTGLVSKSQYKEGAACLQRFEKETQPDSQTAEAVFQLGRLYETGRGVPVDLDHALQLYRQAGRLGAFAPDVAQQAAKSAADLMNRMREREEDATSGQ